MAILEDENPHAAVLMTPALDQGLRASFHRVRILCGSFAVVAVIATIMIVLAGDGVRIETFTSSDKTDDEVKELIDSYNSVSGSIGSAVSKPIELFLELFVAAAFLCLATEFTLGKASIGHWQYVPMLAGAAIAYLFSNGLNALNVQVVTGKLRPRIVLDDLSARVHFSAGYVQDDGLIDAPWDPSKLESSPMNSIENTVLLSKVATLTYVHAPCNGTGSDVTAPLLSMPVVSFGFPSWQWQSDVFLTAMVPTKSLKILMNTSVSDLPKDAALPSPVDVTQGLVNMGSHVLDDLRLASSYDNDYETLGANATANFIEASHKLWLTEISRTTNATMKDATVEYMHFAMSDTITYDAMTLEIPIPVVQRDRFGTVMNTVDGYNQLAVSDYCSREGCILPPPTVSRNNRSTTVQTRVQVTSICLNADGTEDSVEFLPPCKKVSTTAMRVVSVGMRTVGDVWDLSQQGGESVMRLKNLRTVYSITVGRLAWKTEDLAKALDADCGVEKATGNDCTGLRFKAKSYKSDYKSPVLVTGAKSLPIEALNRYAMTGVDKWVYLVTVGDGLGGQRFDVLRPRNFATVTTSGASLKTTAADKCNTYTDDYMRGVEVNHLYMGQSLQPSYTAAFLYLFQNATEVKRDTRTTSVTSAVGAGATTASTKLNDNDYYLHFVGNRQDMDVRVSVPLSNAIVSLVGCGLLLLVTAGVVVMARKSERELEARANAELVAEAMMNSSKYPPWLLEMALQQAAAIHAGHTQLQMVPLHHQLQDQHADVVEGQQQQQQQVVDKSGCVSLQDLRVQSVVLQYQDDVSHTLLIGPEIFKPQ